ncbi:MAG: single-stranded DNA-binding protein [Verrucomicrobia bacterium]|nr:single-stranded DNA-binding protein [Verrucomicrobiota bacterium]
MSRKSKPTTATELIRAAKRLSTAVGRLKFKPPVTHVYNPLAYAWSVHEMYLRKYGCALKRVVFLGMNPGPFGMAQTGVPFGEVNAVRDWLRIEAPIGRPLREHRKRPVEGFACPRSEVSGRRLWGLFAARFGRAEDFFADHFVVNYCPLAFFDAAGRNITPDKLSGVQSAGLFAACDNHLRRVVEVLRPAWLVGLGDFAEKRARMVFASTPLRIGKVLHPSPASPAANRGWAAQATAQLCALGVWE